MSNDKLQEEIDKIYNFIENAVINKDSIRINLGRMKIKSIEGKFEQDFQLKKRYGAYYTDQRVSEFIFTKVLMLYLKKRIRNLTINKVDDISHISPNIKEVIVSYLFQIKICDPACGLGAFLLSALDVIKDLILKLNPNTKLKDLILGLLKNLFGYEVNQFALKICKVKLLYWALNLLDHDYQEALKIISTNIILRNSLFHQKTHEFDLVIGNPPYGNIMSNREKKILKNEKIYYNDIYCAFILKSLLWANAVIGFLIPKSFLLRQSYLDFRNQFLSKANIIEIYDLGPNLFKQATNEVQIMIFEKKQGIDIESSIYLYPNDKIISYTDQNYDNLNICLNISCPLCSAVQKVYVYTFESKCPYCGKPTIKLNRIRIKINKFDKKIIDKIEITGNLNFLNVKDFPKLIRGEEAKGLKEIRKLVKVKARGSCYFIYAKDDFHYYYYKTNKYFDLFELDPKMLKGENYEYYTKPKLLIKHNNIIPQASYSEDCTCFTSSIYSLLDDNAETLKFICAVLNSSIIQFYCLFAINNQQNTTINLNQYMIRHLPIKIVDDSVKSTVNRKVDSIINAFKASEGKITKKIAKLWQEIDGEIFKIYSFSEEDKNYILKSVQSEIAFINLIYSVKIK